MIPLDNDFILMYSVYGLLFIFLLLGLYLKKESKAFKNNLLFFIAYSLVLSFFFLDKSNFQGGSSLVVLFYGMLFLLAHLFIFTLRRTYIWIEQKNKN